jgi:hypothetical protein
MNTPDLPDDIRDAIDRAARAVRRRHQHRAGYLVDKDGPFVAEPSLDDFAEDIADQLVIPLARRDAQVEALLAAIEEAISLNDNGMSALAWERLRSAITTLT